MDNSPLWKHQTEAIRKALELGSYGLFFEQGTGKTRTAIEILRRWYQAIERVEKTIILAPAIVLTNWKREFAKYSKIPQHKVYILFGPGAKRCKQMEFIKKEGHAIVITNYEALQMEPLMNHITEWAPEILICDESHRLKNPQGKRAKEAFKLASKTSRRLILTGTPILNNPADIFQQFKILDLGATFGDNFYAFRARYFEDKNATFQSKRSYFPNWQPRADMFPDMHDRIQRKAVRVVKSDCLDLPPLVRQTVDVPLGREQARMYKEMLQEFVAFVSELRRDSGVTPATIAQLAVTKALRLQQIVTGFCTLATGDVHRIKDSNRIAVLTEVLADLVGAHKVIVWAAFKENYKMIGEALDREGIKYRLITGDQSHSEKQESVDLFERDDDCRVLVANQSAGGIGINLVRASYSIFFSKNFSLEADLQAEARNYRAGSEIHECVTRIDLVSRGTIDELVTAALAGKLNVAESILNLRETDVETLP